MSKKEIIDEIVYNLKLSGNVDFEVDDESYTVDSLEKGYVIQSICRYIEVKNLTDFRKEVSKLGKKFLCL